MGRRKAMEAAGKIRPLQRTFFRLRGRWWQSDHRLREGQARKESGMIICRPSLRGLLLAGVCALIGGCINPPLGKDTEERRSPLSAAGQRVFGFESLADWTVSGGTATLSNQRDEGAHSLQLASTGWVSVTSAPVSSPVGPTSLLAVDVIIPHLQSPNWNGQTQILLNVPSRGIYNVALTARQFAFPYVTFQRMQFDVPPSIVSQLAGTFNDLRVTVTVSGGAGSYLLDNLRFITAAEGATPVAATRSGAVLDFEDPNLWVAYQPAVLASSDRSVRGGHSLAVSNIGWTRLDSAPIATPGRADAFIALNLVIPSPQPSGWRGGLDLSISVPSAGLNDVLIGHKELAGLALDQFQRIQFALPTNVQTALSANHSDARFSIVLNVPYGTPGRYLLDYLRLRHDPAPGVDPELPPIDDLVNKHRAAAHDQPAQPPPPLGGSGDAAVASTRTFLAWMGQSRSSQVVSGRQIIQGARANTDVANALVAELNASDKDLVHRLLVLSVLGELKSSIGESAMISVVDRAVPPGPADSAPVLATTVLQTKAVDGLGFMRSSRSKAKLLSVAGQHPSRMVRLEAVRAYLDNFGTGGRADLAAVVQPAEAIFLDSFYHRSEVRETTTFDQKMQQYIAAHPEAVNPGAP
jgi:hypothetical protein